MLNVQSLDSIRLVAFPVALFSVPVHNDLNFNN
jgi:hypothetical protein